MKNHGHAMTRRLRRVLTVGDGDLSYSLALARAYDNSIDLTATTLLSEQELRETYSAAAGVLTELRHAGEV